MMTYNQAKVFESFRQLGATTIAVIEDNNAIAPAVVIQTLVALVEEGWAVWSNINGQRVFAPTDAGKIAYEKWREIPF